MRLRLLTTLLLLAALALHGSAQALRIHIAHDPAVDDSPISRLARQDFTALLDTACHCIVGDPGQASVVLTLLAPTPGADTVPTPLEAGRNYPYYHVPNPTFRWQSRQGNPQQLSLSSPTPHGIANGLYALLQEQLGFQFLHPRKTIVPQLVAWPIPGTWTLDGKPKFDKRGFHLHTMHPLELTQPLHDPAFPGGPAMIQEYIQWLARNGQNYFEFSLMEDVDHHLADWVTHAAQFTAYAHDRGILCGLDLSIHMVQQKAYQLAKFPPHDFRSYEYQIRHRLRILMRADWDFINLEFALAEFVGGLEHLRNRLRDAVIAEMDHYPDTKLIGRQHVVKPEDEMGGSHGQQSLNVPSDPRMGVLVHTVMCYALTDSHAPVYELQNFSHLHDLLILQNQQRETWFYPESAYWVTFDNSIPLLLLPYLNARYQDIQTCAALGIPGHVTFSSGWEWGYWLVDWSIARWSWDYERRGNAGLAEANGQILTTPTIAGPYQYLRTFFPTAAAATQVATLADLQQDWLIRGNLLRWLCPSNPTDELPKPMNKQFQPRGFVNLGDLGYAAKKMPARITDLPIDSLRAYADSVRARCHAVAQALDAADENRDLRPLAQEILDALAVTAYRADHSRHLMEAVQSTMGLHGRPYKAQTKALIQIAANDRLAAVQLVRQQESRYRYPLPLLAGKYRSYTAYDFGYLYTVHDLHFWEREEQQNLNGRHGPFFRNIYDLAKIAGLRN